MTYSSWQEVQIILVAEEQLYICPNGTPIYFVTPLTPLVFGGR